MGAASSNWWCSSDRKLKENFQPLDVRDVLRRVVEMPVTRWTFSGHPNWPHIGTMAQDFHAAFGLGDADDNTHIDAGDSLGVALAAIQGLHQVVQEKDVKIEALQRRVAQLESLRDELAGLKAAFTELQAPEQPSSWPSEPQNSL